MAAMPCTTCTCCQGWNSIQQRWEQDRIRLESRLATAPVVAPSPPISTDYPLMQKLDAMIFALQGVNATLMRLDTKLFTTTV